MAIGDTTTPDPSTPPDAMQADDYIVQLEAPDEGKQAEEAAVRKFFERFKQDREFDKNIRGQINRDRAYASGASQAQWAVSTNVIGALIDILVATLYARDPDLSARKPKQVDLDPDPVTGLAPDSIRNREMELFATTLELVISQLWKKGKLKQRMRRIVRGVLSSSHGWLKIMPSGAQIRMNPLVQSQVNSVRDNLENVTRMQAAIAAQQTEGGAPASVDDLAVMKQDLQALMDSLTSQMENTVYECFTIDVVKPENMQIGTDVELLVDHTDSNSNTEIMFIPHDELLARFPRLTAEDVKPAQLFYRKPPRNANDGAGVQGDASLEQSLFPTNSDGEQYGTTKPGSESTAFARVLEKWCRDDQHIRTGIDGVKKWAREPYMPNWATDRFYPYFYFSVYEVDDSRAPQSLSARLAKLQDEYAATRSTFRIARERSVPGLMFNAGSLPDDEAKKIERAVRNEIIGVRTTDPNMKLGDLFTEKPSPRIDPRLYDTQPILSDMERIAGVQEAQQAAISVEKTATEAEIQQAGFSARTACARDMLESTLTDVARYCAQLALQTIPADTVQRMVGPGAMWPVGMSREDITTLVEIDIVAGTTGKPRNRGDREAWATVLPVLRETQAQIAQYLLNPATVPLANALMETLKETMVRMGDDSDPGRFLPKPPPAQALLAAPGAGAPLFAGTPPGAAPSPPTAGPIEAGVSANSPFPPME